MSDIAKAFDEFIEAFDSFIETNDARLLEIETKMSNSNTSGMSFTEGDNQLPEAGLKVGRPVVDRAKHNALIAENKVLREALESILNKRHMQSDFDDWNVHASWHDRALRECQDIASRALSLNSGETDDG